MFYGVVSVWYLHQVKKALWWARLRWFQAVACKSQAALQRCSLFCASGDWLKTMMQNETAPKSKSNKANPHPVERQHTWTELCRCFSHVGSGWCDDTLQSQTNCQQSQIESMKQSWHTRHTCSSRLYHRQPYGSWLGSRLCISQATVPQSWAFFCAGMPLLSNLSDSQMFQHVSTIFSLCYPPLYKSWPFRRSETVLSWHLRQSLHSNLAVAHARKNWCLASRTYIGMRYYTFNNYKL